MTFLKALKELGLSGEFKKEGANTVLSVEEKSDSEGSKDITPMETRVNKNKKKYRP